MIFTKKWVSDVQLITTNQFNKSLKRCIKRGLPMDKFKEVLHLLVHNGSLPKQYKPHKLRGNREGEWECHIQPDWLLIWEQNNTELALLLVDTGSHSDLF